KDGIAQQEIREIIATGVAAEDAREEKASIVDEDEGLLTVIFRPIKTEFETVIALRPTERFLNLEVLGDPRLRALHGIAEPQIVPVEEPNGRWAGKERLSDESFSGKTNLGWGVEVLLSDRRLVVARIAKQQ